MKRRHLLPVIASLTFAFGLAAVAQDSSHVTDPRKETSPSYAQNNPDRGAWDPARIGTMTGSNNDLNNNRYPVRRRETEGGTITVKMSDIPKTEEIAVAAPPPPAPIAAPEPEPAIAEAYTAPALPRTASRTPLVGLVGLAALGTALALRASRG